MLTRRIAVAVFITFNVFLTLPAQESAYDIVRNLSYYPDSVIKNDAYLSEQCVMDIYYPKNKKDFATIVWIHGGGLTYGDQQLPEMLKNKGFCIVGINYRLHPHVHAPKYIEDAAAAVAWTFENIAEYGGNPDKIFVSGHSAGAYLTLMVGLDKRWLGKHSIDANRIAALIPLSGQTITHFTIRKERGISDKQPVIDDMAPLYHVRGDAPPVLLITGDRELEYIGRYEENAYLYRMMKLVGHQNIILHELQGYGHDMEPPAFPLMVKYIQKLTGKQ